MHVSLPLMFGLPGQGMHLRIDVLSAVFLLLLLPQTVASAIAGMHRSATFWAFVLGMVLAVVAGDVFTLIFGLGLMSAASWLLVLSGDRAPALLYIGIAIFAAACLIPAMFLPASGFAFMLILMGAGAKAGLAPLHGWLPRAHPAPEAGVSALMSGGMVKIALYVILRFGFLTFGDAAQPWWGTVLIAMGAASVLLGALRAVLEVELKTILACSTVEHVGLIAVGAGIALRAKVMGDLSLAALALQGALLCAVAHALYKPLLFLGAGAVKRATGTASLDWLGGLMRGMPKLGLLMLGGASGLAAVPFGPGFAPEFLLLHAVIAAAGTGGIFARIGFTALLAVLGLSAALALGAAVRLIGIGFLGRPRTLAAAAAEDARRPELLGMGLLAVLCVPVALLPGMVLLGLNPAVRLMVPGATPAPLVYAPLGLAVLLAVALGAAYGFLRRFGVRGTSEVAAWNGGFGRPPVWLPFGDPATQPSATGFAQPVYRALGEAILPRGGDPTDTLLWRPLFRLQLRLTRGAEYIRRATIRQRLAFVFLVLVAFLAALGLDQGG